MLLLYYYVGFESTFIFVLFIIINVFFVSVQKSKRTKLTNIEPMDTIFVKHVKTKGPGKSFSVTSPSAPRVVLTLGQQGMFPYQLEVSSQQDQNSQIKDIRR